MENYFFELPVYRCSKEIYERDLKEIHSKIDSTVVDVKGHEQSTAEAKAYLIQRQTYNYEYNEVIGWIKLYVLGNQIRGEYHFEVDLADKNYIKKRFNRGIRKKQFEYIGKAFEISIDENINSKDVYSNIVDEIENLMKNEKPFKGRFIDISKLEKLANFIDWNQLLKKLNPFNY